MMTNADVVVHELIARGIRTIFTVSGNQILPLIDAAGRSGIRLVHMRHETAAVYAAIAASEVTGEPAIALVSAGPGFLASLQGLGVASSMELPILLLSGASPVSQRGFGAFQELDQYAIASSICKGSFEITETDPIGSVAAAWNTALNDVPGPTHLALPADILASPAVQRTSSQSVISIPTFDDDMLRTLDAMATALSRSRRPLVIARPAAARSPSGNQLSELTDRLGIEPVITESPRGLSDLKYTEIFARLADADCLLVVGPADFSSGFLASSTIGNPRDILLIDAPGDPIPKRSEYLHARAPLREALSYLATRIDRDQPVTADWAALWPLTEPSAAPATNENGMHPLAISGALRTILQADDTVILDGGEFCQWIRYGLRDLPNRILWNGKLGAIGGSIPMAVGAAISATAGRVFAVLGDGSAGYHLSEFETATREGIAFTSIIGNDARWAAEWHMQIERYGSDRTYSTDLSRARYDIAATGYGGTGDIVDSPETLRNALASALTSALPTCINVSIAAERSPATVTH